MIKNKLTNTNYVTVYLVKVSVVSVLISLCADINHPKLRNSVYYWTRVLCKRMERRKSVYDRTCSNCCAVQEKIPDYCS